MNKLRCRILIQMLFAIIFCSGRITAQETRITGNVRDCNNDPIPYTTVRLQETSKGCITDNNGNFSFIGPIEGQTLIISSIGYHDVKIELTRKITFPLNVILQPQDYELNEIVVKPKREQYRKRGNPAVEIMEHILSGMDSTDIRSHTYYSRDRYESLLLALDDFDSKKQNNSFFRAFPDIANQVDTSLVSGKPILNLSLRESAITDYYQQAPKKFRTLIKGRKWEGVDDFMSADELQDRIDILLSDVDFYNEKVVIFRQEFVSPISQIGLNFYKYYIMDTLMVDNEQCIDLAFVPKTPESFGFSGHLYIVNDSTYFAKWIQVSVPFRSNVNFFKYFNIDQKFERTADGTRTMTDQSLTAVIYIYDFLDGIYCKRDVSYSNYRFDSNVDLTLLNNAEEEIELTDAKNRDDVFWAEQLPRDSAVQAKTIATRKSISSMLETLRANKFYCATEKVLSVLFSGFIPVSPEPSPFYFGPVNTTISFNGLEGARFRIGGMTGAKLSPHWFFRGYLAYGVNDRKFKYMASAEYSFNAKKEHNTEFPTHSIKLVAEDDIYQYGQQYITNKDNFLLSIRRRPDNKIGYVRKQELIYTKEFNNHFTIGATARHRTNYTSRFIKFDRVEGSDTIHYRNINQTELELYLRFAPGEQFIQRKWNRRNVDTKYPVFTLSHTMSRQGLLGSDYSYMKTEFSYTQRIYMSMFGYSDIVVKAGYIWGQVPYPLLFIPNANLSYTLRTESFELLDPMEFIFDRYVQWDWQHHFNGLFLNRIPLVRKLNLREIVVFKGLWGNISRKNDPRANNPEIYMLPDNVLANRMTKPYMEIGVGLDNILKLFRIDYYHRLTYTDVPNVDKWGIRIRMIMNL